LVDELYKKPVPFVDNYSNTLQEPVVLPSKLPVALLVNNF
jgi:DNA gyrase/topoisomerase IV subunit A